MTITTNLSAETLDGNGSTTSFPFSFRVFTGAQLQVWLTDSDGIVAQTTDFSAVLTDSGGTVTYPVVGTTKLPSGSTITIMRDMEFTQPVDLVNATTFHAEVVEDALDNLTMQIQQVKETADRAVQYPAGTAAEDILDSTDFLDATAANATAAQAAQTAAEAAQGLAETARSQAQGYAASASGSAASAAASADAAAEIVSTGLPTASTSIKGVVQLATSAEVSTGTDAAKAVTPAALKPALDAKLDASGALAAIGAAASGANSDITSLSGLTTPLSVAQGGTGGTTGLSDSSALAVMYALLYCRSESRASGPIPYGYLFPLLTDELATKTGAVYATTNMYYQGFTDIHRYAIDGASDVDLYSGIRTALGQSFVPASTVLLSAAEFKIAKSGSPTGSVCVKLYAATGTHGTSAMPTGAALATSAALDVAMLPTSTTVTAFNFPSPYTVTAATTYVIVLEYNGGDASNKLLAASDTVTRTDEGNWCHYTTSWSTSAIRDQYFSVLTTAVVADMTLIPAAVTAGAHPNSMTVRFLHKAVDSVTYGTDLKVRVSTDDGTNWSAYGTITKLCTYDANYDLLEATFDTSALEGVSLKPEISTANTKSQRVAGIAISYT